MTKELVGQDRLLFEQIIQALKSNSQYVVYFEENEVEDIEKVRALGRRAGRELGWKVRTFASDPNRSEHRTVRVIVAVEESSPLHEQLMRARGRKVLRRAFMD